MADGELLCTLDDGSEVGWVWRDALLRLNEMVASQGPLLPANSSLAEWIGVAVGVAEYF